MAQQHLPMTQHLLSMAGRGARAAAQRLQAHCAPGHVTHGQHLCSQG